MEITRYLLPREGRKQCWFEGLWSLSLGLGLETSLGVVDQLFGEPTKLTV